MSTQKNKARVARVYAEIMNDGDLNVADELFAPEYVYRSPGSPEFRGPEGFKQLVRMYRDAFSGFRQHPNELLAEGDTVVSRWTVSGTHRAEFMGIPATGRYVTFDGVVITRFAGGKVVEDWELADTMGLLQQLGGIPTPEAV